MLAIRPLARSAPLRCLAAPVRAASTLSPRTGVYTAVGTSTGSRAKGTARTKEGNIDLKMGMPVEMGGSGGPAAGLSNPEQLFGLAYSTCFLSALAASHSSLNPSLKPLPKATAVRALVSIGKTDVPGFMLAVALEIPQGPLAEVGLDQEAQQKLVDAAHALCPYSRATKGNIEVEIKLVEA